ncbi:hypothetical protein ES703_113356 [subsurface metagenome]
MLHPFGKQGCQLQPADSTGTHHQQHPNDYRQLQIDLPPFDVDIENRQCKQRDPRAAHERHRNRKPPQPQSHKAEHSQARTRIGQNKGGQHRKVHRQKGRVNTMIPEERLGDVLVNRHPLDELRVEPVEGDEGCCQSTGE